MYSTKEFGTRNSTSYRIFFTNKDGNVISPFHDIPLHADKDKNVFNMVVEIPRWTNAKMEISKEDEMNPIKQDVKKGKVRFVKNVFPYHGYIWNYGALPQTWENPNVKDDNTSANGDDDPIDVVEIGDAIAQRGEVKQVKVLGVLAMIDEGETDWKVLCIDIKDPKADQLDDIKDVEAHMPGLLSATRDWFRTYKTPDVNKFAFNGEWKGKDFALKIIADTNKEWCEMVKCKDNKICTKNVTLAATPGLTNPNEASKVLEGLTCCSGAGDAIPAEVDNQVFVKRAVEEHIILKSDA